MKNKPDPEYPDFKDGVDILHDLMKDEKGKPDYFKMHTRHAISVFEEMLDDNDVKEEQKTGLRSCIKWLKELVKEVGDE